jgi:vacuolar-type H+-ATPase subunit I/STV1
MPSSEETYLEAFVETLGTLPYETRRNLELIRDLDQSCATDLQSLRELHASCILAAEKKVLQLQVVRGASPVGKPGATVGVRVLGGSNEVVLPNTDEFIDYVCSDSKMLLQRIYSLQEQCLQKSDEKVSVAQQAYELIDARVERLEEDLAAMEQQLLVCVG